MMICRVHAGICLLVLLTLPGAVHGQAAILQTDTLRLELEVDHEAGTLSGTAKLTVRNRGDHPLAELPFQLGRLMTVTAVRQASTPLPFSQDVVRLPDWDLFQLLELQVQLPSPLGPQESATLEIDYEGRVVGYTETGMSYVRDRISDEFTLIRSDALSFPVPGEASLASMRAQPHADFAFSGSVTVVDPELVVASAAHRGVENLPDGRRRWVFEGDAPAPFLFLAIAPFERGETEGALIYHLPEDRDGAARVAESLERVSTLYDQWLGPRGTRRRIVIMEIPEGWGSQAHPVGGIIQTADAFRSAEQLPQLHHELAHLWHPVDIEVPSDRWNEGFATFLQWRVESGGDSERLAERMEALGERIGRMEGALPAMDLYGESRQTDLAYRTGAILFYALFAHLGEAGFDECITRFFNAHRESGAKNTDFLTAIGSCGPGADTILADWFTSSRGPSRLQNGESLPEILQSYLGRSRPAM